MNNFLRELRIELNRRNLYQSEIDEIVSYYEEIINDRIDLGESLDQILAGYDVKVIARNSFPQALQRRADENPNQKVSNNVWSLVVFLFSIPVLIPLGVLYIAFIIVIFALIISCFAVTVSGLLGIVGLIIQLISQNADLGSSLLIVGFVLTGISVAILLLVTLTKGLWYILKYSVVFIAKLISGGKKHENSY